MTKGKLTEFRAQVSERRRDIGAFAIEKEEGFRVKSGICGATGMEAV
jgi:hypothetical protein